MARLQLEFAHVFLVHYKIAVFENFAFEYLVRPVRHLS